MSEVTRPVFAHRFMGLLVLATFGAPFVDALRHLEDATSRWAMFVSLTAYAVSGLIIALPAWDGRRFHVVPTALSATLFLVAAASEQKIFAPVFETLINAVYREIEMAYAANGGHPLSPRLLMMLDEAANIAKVRRLPEMASAGAGQGLLLVTVWQDEGQIVTAFSADVARTIMSNHWARVYLGGISDAQTLRNLSALIGKDVMTLSSTSSNDSLGGRVSRGRTEHEFEVAPAGSLSALRGGESIVVCAGYKPMRLRQRGWWESKELRAMVPAEVAARFDADYATTASKRTTSRR